MVGARMQGEDSGRGSNGEEMKRCGWRGGLCNFQSEHIGPGDSEDKKNAQGLREEGECE